MCWLMWANVLGYEKFFLFQTCTKDDVYLVIIIINFSQIIMMLENGLLFRSKIVQGSLLSWLELSFQYITRSLHRLLLNFIIILFITSHETKNFIKSINSPTIVSWIVMLNKILWRYKRKVSWYGFFLSVLSHISVYRASI